MITCRHGGVESVLDYAVVPRQAREDMQVIPVEGGLEDHRALCVWLRVPGMCSGVAVSEAQSFGTPVVRLTLEE